MNIDEKYDVVSSEEYSDEIPDSGENIPKISNSNLFLEKKFVTLSQPWEDQEITIETGNWAKQAHGAVVYRCGKLVLLATVCAEKEPQEGQDFFPLTVEYREKSYAVGKFPGGFVKRESKPLDHEILISRLIDRPIRPLFPEGYFCEVQLLVTVLSADPERSLEGHAITAASAAIQVSDIPFHAPVAGVVVGYKDGKFYCDPKREILIEGEMELVVAGTESAVTMIEGEAKEVPEDILLKAIEFAHEKIKEKIQIQKRLVQELQPKKREISLKLPDANLKKLVYDYAYEQVYQANKTKDKKERARKIEEINKQTLDYILRSNYVTQNQLQADSVLKEAKNFLHELEYDVVRRTIFEEGIRADGRKVDEIREIQIEIDVLPSTHGSAVFTRGQTQSLGVVTLGAGDDFQLVETVYGEEIKKFMLHYNFPPFSTGEVKRLGPPARREIGHGHLAERALKAVIPNQEEFPYIIRVVSEILESNGSSSMASVCSGSLALMCAGVPIKRHVAGIAMGLIKDDETGKYLILSDIAGIEDHFGDMDFKIAGTRRGVTALQLDIKTEGLSLQILKDAIEQATRGKNYILDKMEEVISKPREQLAPTAPSILSVQIDVEKIGELIGPGGRIIKSIIERTGADVWVEQDGKVMISASNQESALKAKQIIENMFKKIEVGQIFKGVVKRITDFGAFIEIMPGKEGLLHISKMSPHRISSVREVMDVGDEVSVAVLDIDNTGRISLIIKDLHEKKEDKGPKSTTPNRPPRVDKRYRY
ncbi:MAG: polyribonucleotide nucleotidyltransferase [Leptospiraceae bacterium]|nr:polyribonucleotide nucleotidyltransferase [Leptospiraceae bacterium]MDW7976857.1 polyribonucleotide nucleotidyltransferase [Leptospiraceae bacterium]